MHTSEYFRSCRATRVPRRGTAPIEFVFFLPIFVCFLVVIIWITRVNNAAIQASLDAESEVVKEAALMVTQNRLPESENLHQPTSPELANLIRGFDPTADLFGGKVAGYGERDTGEGVGQLIPAAGSAFDEQQALAHTWESELFQFPISRSEQPPLTLPSSVRGIASTITNINAFSGLLSFSGKSNSGASALVDTTKNKLGSSLPRIDAAIAQLKSDINRLEQQIRSLQNEPLSDPKWISRLQNELAAKKRQLQKLIQGKANGQSALGIPGLNTTPYATDATDD